MGLTYLLIKIDIDFLNVLLGVDFQYFAAYTQISSVNKRLTEFKP